MKTRSMGLLAAALLVVGACSKSHREPVEQQDRSGTPGAAATARDAAPPLPDSDALVAYMQATIAAVDAAKGDCARLVDPVLTLIRDNSDLLAEMVASHDSPAARKWISDHFELFRQFQARLGVVAGCAQSDPRLVEALEKLSKPAGQPAADPAPGAR